MLITESMHLSEAVLAGQEVGAVPKGYLYFAIAFSLGVEFLNMRMRKKKLITYSKLADGLKDILGYDTIKRLFESECGSRAHTSRSAVCSQRRTRSFANGNRLCDPRA